MDLGMGIIISHLGFFGYFRLDGFGHFHTKNNPDHRKFSGTQPKLIYLGAFQQIAMRQSKEYTVLYVDDEHANLRSFKSAFRRIYNVIISDNPLEGIEIVKGNKINIVISDHRMPELIGTDFLREVHHHDNNIRRIILSGFVKKEELQEANEEFGIHAYISKPWDFDHLQAIFTKLLSEEASEKMIYD